MRTQEMQKTTYLKDYMPPNFHILQTDLCFDLFEDHALVESKLRIERNGAHNESLVLHGEELELVSLTLNGGKKDHLFEDENLVLKDLPDVFELQIKTKIYPQKNFQLKGLYQSSGNFCTQCEAEGFRRITYFMDRPDVLSIFTVTLKADAQKYPILLSNGNPKGVVKLEDGRHQAVWHDPHPKPAYLFAVVAGDLDCLSDHFTTFSGKEVDLNIYVEKGHQKQASYAMDALKRSMKWDEEVYGCEYDLDVFNIVAVADFNMGAMENKGLNIFNSKYVLADQKTATDTDYEGVETVIAHEYFHNWTGNRVTCRDWFQLSLKEGLTVFRDQEFSADMNNRGVCRIEDVKRLRSSQFPEDASPMAHSIRPDQYIEIDNFYTATIYNKGAEIIRMMHCLLGKDNFRKGTDLYFERHDGQAVTCDDFVAAMQDASGVDLSYFKHWYQQAGTPIVTVTDSYDENEHIYRITFKQETKATPNQSEKKPLMIPIRFGLIDKNGREMALPVSSQVKILQESEKTFTYKNVPSRPIPSVFRGFSAPIKIVHEQPLQTLSFLTKHDTDDFNRWEASQKLYKSIIKEKIKNPNQGTDPILFEMIDHILKNEHLSLSMKAELLCLPSMTDLSLDQKPITIDENFKVLQTLKDEIGQKHYNSFVNLYHELNTSYNELDAENAAKRKFKNLCLSYALRTKKDKPITLAERQILNHQSMTDKISALAPLAHLSDTAFKEDIYQRFYDVWQGNYLIVNKWFALQAVSTREDTFEKVKELTNHPAFNIKNPNNVYALLLGFASANPYHFHQKSGEAYNFIADKIIEINQFNPSPAARLTQTLIRWQNYDAIRATKMKAALKKILESEKLSKDVYEIASKGLGES